MGRVKLPEEEKASCCTRFSTSLDVCRAVFVRLMLAFHATVAYSRVVDLLGDLKFWFLMFSLLPMAVEMLVTCIVRKGQDYKWVCPCFLLYLVAVVPSIWLLELDRLANFQQLYSNTSNTVQITSIEGLEVPVKLSPQVWVAVVEQTLLLVLIVGRWLLPRGRLSKDQISQMLFVYIGMASDIMEIFYLFDETVVRLDINLTYAVLAAWTLSLMQFPLVLAAVRSPKKTRMAIGRGEDQKLRCCFLWFRTEMWSLVLAMLMQDGPFVAIRLFTIFYYNLMTYSIVFFTCKNFLVLCMTVYRLTVICMNIDLNDDDDDGNNNKAKKERRMSIKRQSSSRGKVKPFAVSPRKTKSAMKSRQVTELDKI